MKKSADTGDRDTISTGDDIPCFWCGVCCTGYQVHMELHEAQGLAAKLGMDWSRFRDYFVDRSWPGTRSVLLAHDLHGCLFLDQPEGSIFGMCRIHDFKPQCCRDWQAKLYKKECRQGLSKYWGLSVDENDRIAGSSNDIRIFQTFLNYLKQQEDLSRADL